MTTILYVYEQKFRAWRRRLAGLYRVAREHGWHVRSLEISEVKGSLAAVADFWQASGAILEGGIASHPKLRGFDATGLPVVWCDADAGCLGPKADAVVHDSRETARVATAELLKRNCAAYGYVGFDVKRDWSRERGETFAAELARAGADCRFFDPTQGHRFGDVIAFYTALEAWLMALPRPCGIFAANDEMGDHVLRAAMNCGIAVPDEMIVIGVDNDELLCESTLPALASVSPDFEKSGELAAGLLSARLANPRLKPQVQVFGCGQVVPRASIRAFKYRDYAALKAVEYIRLQACAGIKVDDVAEAMGVSRRAAELRFRRLTGSSIREEIENVRFRRACELIRRPDIQLDRVHEFVGYSSARSLRALFYRLTGLSPAAWRKSADV